MPANPVVHLCPISVPSARRMKKIPRSLCISGGGFVETLAMREMRTKNRKLSSAKITRPPLVGEDFIRRLVSSISLRIYPHRLRSDFGEKRCPERITLREDTGWDGSAEQVLHCSTIVPELELKVILVLPRPTQQEPQSRRLHKFISVTYCLN